MIESTASDLEQRAQVALRNSPIYDLRDLRVQREGDMLMLSGHVDSFYHKQLAQEAVRAVAGELQVVNGVDVE